MDPDCQGPEKHNDRPGFGIMLLKTKIVSSFLPCVKACCDRKFQVSLAKFWLVLLRMNLTWEFPGPFSLQQLSVLSKAIQRTKLKVMLWIRKKMKSVQFTKQSMNITKFPQNFKRWKLTQHCPLVPLRSQVFSALDRVDRDTSCNRKKNTFGLSDRI